MARQLIGAWVFGLVGVGILVSLGVWQLQRLQWKEAILSDIELRIVDAPVALPDSVDPEVDRFLPVVAEGQLGPEFVRFLVSQRGVGAGYRIVSPMQIGSRRVLVDRGIMPTTQEAPPVPEGLLRVTGNLHWPQERDGFTPENDIDDNLWFARDVEALAAHFEAEPVLIVAREMSVDDAPLVPLPVSAEGIPNDHLNYAVTWFGLALVWMGMTLYLLWRIRQRRT